MVCSTPCLTSAPTVAVASNIDATTSSARAESGNRQSSGVPQWMKTKSKVGKKVPLKRKSTDSSDTRYVSSWFATCTSTCAVHVWSSCTFWRIVHVWLIHMQLFLYWIWTCVYVIHFWLVDENLCFNYFALMCSVWCGHDWIAAHWLCWGMFVCLVVAV